MVCQRKVTISIMGYSVNPDFTGIIESELTDEQEAAEAEEEAAEEAAEAEEKVIQIIPEEESLVPYA